MANPTDREWWWGWRGVFTLVVAGLLWVTPEYPQGSFWYTVGYVGTELLMAASVPVLVWVVRTAGRRSHQITVALTGADGSTPGPPDDWDERLPISKYWFVVGGAFAVCIPIAVFRPTLGMGILSAFLTAYALSHQQETESGNEA